jgi:hypothetical protein
MLCKEMIAVFAENHMKHIAYTQYTALLIIRTDGTYNYRWALNS